MRSLQSSTSGGWNAFDLQPAELSLQFDEPASGGSLGGPPSLLSLSLNTDALLPPSVESLSASSWICSHCSLSNASGAVQCHGCSEPQSSAVPEAVSGPSCLPAVQCVRVFLYAPSSSCFFCLGSRHCVQVDRRGAGATRSCLLRDRSRGLTSRAAAPFRVTHPL